MILNFAQQEVPDQLRCDVCIIGTGPAGTSLALELRDSGLDVIVLEAGGHKPDNETTSLYEADVVGLPHDGIHDGRARVFGGTSTLWGGQSLPLDPIDFEKRDWVDDSGWPISLEELSPYYPRAERYLNIEGMSYGRKAWCEMGLKPPSFDPEKIDIALSKFTYKPNFATNYKNLLDTAPNIRILLHANVTELVPTESTRRISHAVIKSLSGKTCDVHADNIVICCGAIESARLLLASQRHTPTGLGNEEDLVGRYFQDHPTGNCAEIFPENPAALRSLYALQYRKDAKYFPKLPLNEKVQREEKTLNITAHLRFEPDDRSALMGLKSMVSDLKSKDIGSLMSHSAVVATQPQELVSYAVQYGIKRHTPVAKQSRIFLRAITEQAPNPDSRVYLSDETDRLGVPKLKLDWRVSKLDRHTIITLGETVKSEFERLKLGRVEIAPELSSCDLWMEPFIDANHHMGTTRMADGPKSGVVTTDCEVFGVKGLYVCSSSVFPTGGSSNPTLTILALAMRLGDRLKSQAPQR